MVKCVCFGCKSGYKFCSDKVRFFIVPKDENTIKLWQIAIFRDDMELKAGHAICEKHFKPEDILQERLRIRCQFFKIQNVGSNIADEF